MSINEINEQAKESLRKYFKDSQDIQHDDDTKKQLTIEEMYQSVDDEIKEQEKKLEELHQMRHALQHNAKEAYEAVYGKTDEAAEVKHTTVEEMEKDPPSLLHFIQKLIEIRNKESVLTSDEFELLDGNVLSYRRGNITVYINITNDIQTIQSEEKEILIASGSFKQDGGKIALSPKSSIVIK